MALPTRQIQVKGAKTNTTFNVQLTIDNPERLNEILAMGPEFEQQAKGLFLENVFNIHKYLIRVTPLDTYELRGGWTSILLKYNQDYSLQLDDISLYDHWKQSNKTERGRQYHRDIAALYKGISESSFEDLPLDVTIINNVPQGEYMEFGTSKIQGRHFTELARYKGEKWFNDKFEEWFEKIAEKENIVKPDSQTQNPIPN